MKILKLAMICIATLLTGCASIVGGTNQVVSVETRDKAKLIAGATCQLSNGKGTYYVTSPGTVTVHRAYDDMNVKCEKENYGQGIATVKSNTKPMAFGNIIFGGVVGAGIDMASGAAYDYPSLITVMMGESIAVPAHGPEHAAQPAQAKTAASTLTSNEATVVSGPAK